jgi:phosphoribosylanthranilate isomerase
MRVKICGITNLGDALAAVAAGADALGFNFAEEARAKNRYIDPEGAREIVEELPPFVTTVAVTVNASSSAVEEYLSFLDRVQFHGDETADAVKPFGARGVKAVRVGEDFDPKSVVDYPVGAVLLDASVPGARGGTGEVADWERAKEAVGLGMPIVLAGGLTPDNVAEAIQTVRPYGVDVAGGVECEPGKKDHERLRRFIEQARVSLSR